MTFKPLLASPAEDIIFPALVSIKIDGIRSLRREEGLVSRNLKPIPNRYIRRALEAVPELMYCDGELLTFTNGKMDDFNTVQSKVMSEGGAPDFKWYAFDHIRHPELAYEERYKLVPQGVTPLQLKVIQYECKNQHELDFYETEAIKGGWEGLIARSKDGRYKYGRSTAKEGILLKVVRKTRATAKIIGGDERLHNANELTTNVMGYAARTSHKANLIGRDDLGAFQCRLDNGVEFSCGTGLDDAQRLDFWDRLPELIATWHIEFEYRGIGPNGKPRFPAFIGLRHPNDL